MRSMGSDLKAYVDRNVDQLDLKCEKHDKNMLKLKRGGEPFCLECRREAVESQDKKMAEEAKRIESMLKESENRRNTYDVFFKDSLIADKTVLEATFDSFDIVDQETEKNKAEALKIAHRYIGGESFNSILVGKQGTGKSHLARSIGYMVNETGGKRVLFIAVDELFRTLKSGFTTKEVEKSEDYILNELIGKADLLILDDLGAESGSIESVDKNGKPKRATEFVTGILYSVANIRQGKSTVVTTNLSGNELAMLYDRRLVSRLLANSKGNVITFEKTSDKRMSLGF